jgi:2-iminobutanoate/2-iminopropanoate deaminase
MLDGMTPITDTPGVAAPSGYAHATVVPAGTELVFVSGQIPVAPDGSVPADFEGQARQAWRNVEGVLRAAGCTFDDVAKITMFICDRVYRDVNRAVRHEFLGDRTPALTVLVTDQWDDAWLIEIEAIAARPPRL